MKAMKRKRVRAWMTPVRHAVKGLFWEDYDAGPPPYDWAWVRPGLATGAIPTTPEEIDVLVANGITHVVNCSSEGLWTEREEAALDERITYLHNPLDDDGKWKPVGWFAETVAFAVPAILAGKGVLVHCMMGSNRGPSNAYAVARVLGHDEEDAKALVRKARPKANLNYIPDAEAAVGVLMEAVA